MDERVAALTEPDAELATRLVADGRYASPDGVVQAAIDALRHAIETDRTMDWDSVRKAAAEGEAAIARGDDVDPDSDAELTAFLDRIMIRIGAEPRNVPPKP
jgi:Arc/MetJ-type ribon-helix-helix transcriptional regulator/plasmid stabilization system protein ParE